MIKRRDPDDLLDTCIFVFVYALALFLVIGVSWQTYIAPWELKGFLLPLFIAGWAFFAAVNFFYFERFFR